MSQSVVSAQDTASFRDPGGRLLLFPDRAIRLVNESGSGDLRKFLSTRTAREAVESGRLVSSSFLNPAIDQIPFHTHTFLEQEIDLKTLVVEHERVPVRSFPYEWPPEMLYAAGNLTLDLAESALDDGYSLKDATPYNVLFRGAQPVFVDLLSFESRKPHDPTWLPLNQFVRTVLLPLLANKYFGLRLDQLFALHRDGLEPGDVARMSSFLLRFNRLFLSLVFMPHWLGGRRSGKTQSIYRPLRVSNAEQSKFILQQQFKRLRRQLRKLKPASGSSNWSEYMTPEKFCSTAYLDVKGTFVAKAVGQFSPRRVLDVGCNTGFFSRFAARAGARVVAIDQDPVVVGRVWHSAASEGLDILPLVINLARPSPSIGWRNEECQSFLERARGNFDLVLMLAVLHHILVTEQVPLEAVLQLAAELTTSLLIIEFVAPEDRMFQTLLRGRDHLFRGLTNESFAASTKPWFETVRVQQLNDTRWLYLLRKRSAAPDV